MCKKQLANYCLAILILVSGEVRAGGTEINLMTNGGFEKDNDSDGVPDGWLGNRTNFSRETHGSVQAYVRNFPPMERLLDGQTIKAADGWVLAQRKAGHDWMAYCKSETCYRRFAREYLPQNSRFGQLPVPAGLELGGTTLVLNGRPPQKQVVTEPIPVKPNSGYRLSFWFKTSGGVKSGAGTAGFQIIDAAAAPGEAETKERVVSGLNLGWCWVTAWTQYEVPFRTGPGQTSIRLRPWQYFSRSRMFRMWYDDFRLVQDDNVRIGDVSDPVNPEPVWPADAVERGFAVCPRATLPLTSNKYQPRPEEIGRPLTISAAPGQVGAGVLFIRALSDLDGPLLVGLKGRPQINGPHGAFLWGGVGGHVSLRTIHPLKLTTNLKQWEMRPHFLMPGSRPQLIRPLTRCWEMEIPNGESRSVLVSVNVPEGTTPGQYKGQIHVVAPGKDYVGYEDSPGNNDGYAIPLLVNVRDVELLEPDVNFGMYAQTVRHRSLAQIGDSYGMADQRSHGMNGIDKGAPYIGTPWVVPHKRIDGTERIEFGPFDSILAKIARIGFGSFMFYQGADLSPKAQLAIVQRCREKGYPEPLFYAYDEPSARGRALVDTMHQQFGEARRSGLRTVTSGLDMQLQGEAYDVWIVDVAEVGGKAWEATKAAGARQGAELWAYDCNGHINTHPRNMRFFTGLWTWAAGLQGNWVWEYANQAFSNSDHQPPENWSKHGFAFSLPSGWGSCLAWEARREGVDDYRYLHTLETAVEAATAHHASSDSLAAAAKYLKDLRARIPIDAFSRRLQTPLLQFEQLALDIAPDEYNRIQENCTAHITAVRQSLR